MSRRLSLPRARMPRAPLCALTALLAATACSSAQPPPPAPRPAAAAVAATPGFHSPARYFLTQSQGAIFDEASRGVAVPRSEPALVSGRRVTLEAGVVTASARAPTGLVGFRSLPPRLGGGYLVWSDLRTYHAKNFLGDLTPLVELGPTAGARPWFASVLLRTDRGMFELDLKTKVTKRWKPQPGVVDALAIDDKRGVTLDAVGRVRATTDGGATWSDVTQTRGYFASAARLGKKGELELVSLSGSADFRLLPGDTAVTATPPPPAPVGRRYYNSYGASPYSYATPPAPDPDPTVDPISQTLAPDSLVAAATAGLLLAGDRVLVSREEGVVVLSTKTGGELDEASLLGIDARYDGCQPVRAGATVLLACAHTEGAEVLVFDGPLAAPKLEATFPDIGSFISDDHGHLAYAGRCGRTPPSADDFGGRVAARPPSYEEDQYGGGYGSPYGGYGGYNPDYPEPSSEEPTEREKPPLDDARVCVRLDGGHWIEHRLQGKEARDLYRWVLGDDGEVTALLLAGIHPDEDEEGGDKDDKDKENGDDGPLRRNRGGQLTPAARGAVLASPTVQPQAAPPPAKPKAASTSQPKAGPPPAKPKSTSTSQPKAGPPPAKPGAKPAPAKPAAKPAVKPVPVKDGMRVVRLDPKDRALKGGKWTRVAPPLTQAPWRSIEQTFWLEDDGSIRGWVRLADEGSGDHGGSSGSGDDGGEKEPPVAPEVSGRFAGVRISPQGKATLLPLPAHAQNVLFGGRFGMARADDDSGDRTTYHETTDGGATWTEVEGPPVGELEEAYDDTRWPACSALGCALASGLVRVGWTSPKPAPRKKDDEFSSSASGADPFPVPRLPRLECRFEGEPEVFPPPAPKPGAAAPKPGAAAAAKPPPPATSDDPAERIRRLLEEAALAQGLLPPGLAPAATASPVAPGASATPGAKPAPGKPAKPAPGKPVPPKAPPAPPADILSLRTKPQAPLGQLKDKTWSADFVVPFDPTAPLKHASAAANGLEKLPGNLVPLLSDRGVDLLLAWDKRRTVLGTPAASLLPFEYSGRFSSAVVLPGFGAASASGPARPAPPAIIALDEDRRVLVLVQPDASRPVLRTARIPDPTRGRFAVARRLDAPGAGLVWYSPISGDVLVGALDFGRAEVGPLAALASLATLTDGGLPACAAAAKPTGLAYELVAELTLPVQVSAHSDKVLFTDSAVPASVLLRITPERACVVAVEARGGGRPLDLSASFGPRGAAVSRSRTSAEDPTKISIEKLSCLLKETASR